MSSLAGVRIVDCHVHVQPWSQLKPDVRRTMTAGRKDLEAIDRFIADPEAFASYLDDEGIARVAIINYPAQDLMGFDETVNDFGAAYRDRVPSRFIAFGGMHPRLCTKPAEEMDRLLGQLRLDGIKLHPPHQLVAANDHVNGNRALATLYEACEAAGVPVMVHTGTSVFPGARGKFGDPLHCDDVAVDFPRLKLILAHGGRPLWMETVFHLARRHANLHVDLSGIPPQRLLDYFPRLEDIADKCLFGTDWPSPGVRRIRDNARAVLELPLSDAAKASILAGTADRLFPPRD